MNTEEIIKRDEKGAKKIDYIKKNVSMVYLKKNIINYSNSKNNKCAICGREFNDKLKAFVDHDHITNKVRGLLCTHCNTLLGMSKDSIEILNKAIEYLQK